MHFVSHVLSAVHVHEVEEAFVTPRVSTDRGLLPADGAALRARVFPYPWCSVCGVELMSAGVLRQLILLYVPVASVSLDGASRKGNCNPTLDDPTLH